jgi:hypothetical protein
MKRLALSTASVLIYLGVQCGVAAANSPPAGGMAELSRLNAEIMHHPKDTALNLRYAALAEKLGLNRLALNAYERILNYDPQNPDALTGINRVRKYIEPNTTRYKLAVGAIYESNPTYVPTGRMPEGQFFGGLSVSDDRLVGDTRWRTNGDITGIAHGENTMLDYAYAGATTGPVWDMLPGITVSPAIGAGGSYLDNHFYYGEGIFQTTFEAYPKGAYEAVQIRAALRDYDSYFVPENTGGYVEALGRFTLPASIPNLAFTLTPWVRWASIQGSLGAVSTLLGEQPGDYTDYGGRINGYYSIEDWVVFSANFSADDRAYRDELVTGSTTQMRNDVTVSPGASLIFPHLFQYQNTLRFDYTYINDHSNDATKSFVDNIVTVTASRGF